MQILAHAVYGDAAPELAMRLLGVSFFVDSVGGVIVETEAYTEDDPASHSFAGPSSRNAAMFGDPGTAYIYRSYGRHWCFNIVGRKGNAVLLRAIEPTIGIDIMTERRGRLPLCAGPGRLAEALGIDVRLDGRSLREAPFRLIDRVAVPEIVIGPRIGITKAPERPWRFGVAGSTSLSRPFRMKRDQV